MVVRLRGHLGRNGERGGRFLLMCWDVVLHLVRRFGGAEVRELTRTGIQYEPHSE